MSHACTVTSFSISFIGQYSDSGFSVSDNEVRCRLVPNSDSRFGSGLSFNLPKMGTDAEGDPVIVVPQVQLTPEQIETIQGVIEQALQATDYHSADFGPAPAPPAE